MRGKYTVVHKVLEGTEVAVVWAVAVNQAARSDIVLYAPFHLNWLCVCGVFKPNFKNNMNEWKN